MRSEALRGHLDLLLLASVESEPAHGYAIIQAVRRSSGGVLDLAEGTVYLALHRLEKARALSSQWSDGPRRRRRVYRLTPRGHRRLATLREEWHELSAAMRPFAEVT